MNLALALLVGVAGPSSFGYPGAAPTTVASDDDLDVAWSLGADRTHVFGEATEPLVGGGATLAVRVAADGHGEVRLAPAGAASHGQLAAFAREHRHGTVVPVANSGARLLGLARTPANAPPGS